MINISAVYKEIYNVGTVDVGQCKFQQYSYSKTAYSLTINIENGTVVNPPDSIQVGGSYNITLEANTDFMLPLYSYNLTINKNGKISDYTINSERSSATFVLSKITGDIVIDVPTEAYEIRFRFASSPSSIGKTKSSITVNYTTDKQYTFPGIEYKYESHVAWSDEYGLYAVKTDGSLQVLYSQGGAPSQYKGWYTNYITSDGRYIFIKQRLTDSQRTWLLQFGTFE